MVAYYDKALGEAPPKPAPSSIHDTPLDDAAVAAAAAYDRFEWEFLALNHIINFPEYHLSETSPVVAAAAAEPELSDYEKDRKARIEANKLYMASLGLGDGSGAVASLQVSVNLSWCVHVTTLTK